MSAYVICWHIYKARHCVRTAVMVTHNNLKTWCHIWQKALQVHKGLVSTLKPWQHQTSFILPGEFHTNICLLVRIAYMMWNRPLYEIKCASTINVTYVAYISSSHLLSNHLLLEVTCFIHLMNEAWNMVQVLRRTRKQTWRVTPMQGILRNTMFLGNT